MCHHATYDVPPEPGSVPAARDFCRRTLDGWELTGLFADAQLVLSELVTNGVLHARTPLAVTLSLETGHLEIAVADASTRQPELRPRRQDLRADLDSLVAEASADVTADDRDPRFHVGEAGSVVGGRGLHLVASLTQDWGVDLAGDGKAVWARLPTLSLSPPSGTPCPCGDADGVRLASGRTVMDLAASTGTQPSSVGCSRD